MNDLPIGVVGGGIVGLAIARELTLRRPGGGVVVFEKEAEVAVHQTGHNSGVVHAGIYYRPGSLKAELCARGRELLGEFCRERSIPYRECGKLVVALDSTELDRLARLETSARANGVPGLTRVDAAGIREIEPLAVGAAAVHSPRTAITDFDMVARAFADDVTAADGIILSSTPVHRAERQPGGVLISSAEGEYHVSRLIVCAGLQTDRLSRPLDGQHGPLIVPFRGEYLRVPDKRDHVRGLIYPVPDPRYPFLGVHFTRRVSGALEIGPNAVLALAREGYRRRDFVPRDVVETLAWPGFWRMAHRHWRTGAREIWGSLSLRAYMKTAQRYVPGISIDDVVWGSAGVRAQAVGQDGSLVDDFCVYGDDRVITIRNAPSPAATSSLAIAEHVVDQMAVG